MRNIWNREMLAAVLIPVLLFAGCAPAPASGLNAEVKDATTFTAEANAKVYDELDFSDEREFENAQRGLIAAPESLEIKGENGNVIWSQKAYAFLDADAPDSANPSLWRSAQLNHNYGLFEVVPGIYQVRGYDVSNITFIEGDTGWIVFDPLMSGECARAALALVNEHLGERPVTGVVYSHSHTDHYGGIKGIISEEEISQRSVPVIAPIGFEEEAVSENVYAGTAMIYRSYYQYGAMIQPGEQGSLGVGIALASSLGTASYIPPSDIIMETGDVRIVDGVEMEFQLTPGTEAPAEMNTWFPAFNALWMAENCNGSLHNLYTLRGAQVRDGSAWAEYLMEAVSRYGAGAEVVFMAHTWPHWGNEDVNEFMINIAAAYKFINDQALMYANQGYTSDEIADMIEMPDALAQVWYTRPNYGTVEHNAKAVYQRYLGWYDANPAHLNPLPPTESAMKYVEYMGDPDEIIARARQDFDKGEYQWVAELMSVLVFADPDNTDARYLGADALEQLGYQAESGIWRNFYLTGADQLRNGSLQDNSPMRASDDLQKYMTPEMLFDYMGILLDANAAQDIDMTINFSFDEDGDYLVTIRSGVLLYQKGSRLEGADATIALSRADLLSLMYGEDADVQVEGDAELFQKLLGHLVAFPRAFNIIEP